MTTSVRQNNLLINQDWTRIYQTFRNADFKSYDFENLRRVMINYLRENYPEDFNDYIESSEYMALIDLLAFLGQSLSFRLDLASRENFIELAERKESVLRIARSLAYNAKRNIPASGLLKFDTVSTTESVLDSSGRNLANQTIVWNDPSNSNWAEQFIAVLNSSMTANTEYGRSQGNATIEGIDTDQYRFNTFSNDVPIYAFNKSVAGRSMIFEVVSTSFTGEEYLYEEDPEPGNQPGFIYRNDGKGPGSSNTGFFMLFKQGSLELADFTIEEPTTNEIVAVDSTGINDADVWLYSLNGAGLQTNLWTKVPSLSGNNIAYNSIANNIRNIYSAITKDKDRVDLVFADGIYGNLPQGPFRLYYRVSNGLNYVIRPNEMTGINLSIPYINASGDSHVLTIGLSLKFTVDNASASETIASIQQNAPATYYTQNRMVTAEDYNLAPLSTSQNILKVKAANRISSGISRNFDLIDSTGRYSGVNVFADDGYIYKEDNETILNFKSQNRFDAINFIRDSIEPIFSSNAVYNFYITKFPRILFTDLTTEWVEVTNEINQNTGYFINNVDQTVLKTGVYTTNTLKYLSVGSLIKFISPDGYYFDKNNDLVEGTPTLSTDKTYIWTKVSSIVGDGTNAGRGVLSNGLGPVTFTDKIPNQAVASRIIASFSNNLQTSLENEMVNLISNGVNFGIRYDYETGNWFIIDKDNLNLNDKFAFGKSGDTTNNNLDSSWIVSFVKTADTYKVTVRQVDYRFGSVKQNRFAIEENKKIYDPNTGLTIFDQIKVLGINTDYNGLTPLKQDKVFVVDSAIQEPDGYKKPDVVNIAFIDSDDDGVIDNPDSFLEIAGEDTELKYLFFVKDTTTQFDTYNYFDNSDETIILVNREVDADINNYTDGQLIYFYDTDEDVVKQVNKTTNTFDIQPNYIANHGRDNLKFQYLHNAGNDRRIDPSASNLIDVYLLPKNYDTEFRNYLKGAIATAPIAPTSDELRIAYGGTLNQIKTVSDEIIYHPVTYKVLFGSAADPNLQAQFKVVKNPNKNINDNNLKVRIISAIDEFFDINNWDFGDRFYIGELITYITTSVAPDISNMVIIPRQSSQTFGSLFEVQSANNEIFVSGASVDDVEIVEAITPFEIARSNTNTTGGTSN